MGSENVNGKTLSQIEAEAGVAWDDASRLTRALTASYWPASLDPRDRIGKEGYFGVAAEKPVVDSGTVRSLSFLLWGEPGGGYGFRALVRAGGRGWG